MENENNELITEEQIQSILNKEEDNIRNNYPDVQEIRDIVKDFDPTDDKYRESLVAEVYYAARRCKSGSAYVVSQALRMPIAEFQHYLNTQPKFAIAYRAGVMDGKTERLESLTNAVYTKAVGTTLVDEKTDVNTFLNKKTGEMVTESFVTKVVKQIGPDATAAIEMLKREDPSWNTKSTVDVNINANISSTYIEDRTIKVDYRKMTPELLKHLIESEKDTYNQALMKREDGITTAYLEKAKKEVVSEVVLPAKINNRGRPKKIVEVSANPVAPKPPRLKKDGTPWGTPNKK